MNHMCELNIDELDTVSGGTPVKIGGADWEYCDRGTPQGGGTGVYPPGTTCSVTPVEAFLNGFKAGGGTLPGGGGGSGSGSGSGVHPA